MRRKTEEKRREIIEVAANAFAELGYERTSMLAIAGRMRGSKQTLYNYFSSKEELLRAVLGSGIEETSFAALVRFRAEAESDLAGALTRLGATYLAHQLSPATMALVRTAANQPPGSTVGREFHDAVIRPVWERSADCLEELMAAGRLRRADPWLAAQQLRGLNLLDLYERHLLDPETPPDPAEIERVSASAAEAFLRIYGVHAEPPAGDGPEAAVDLAREG